MPLVRSESADVSRTLTPNGYDQDLPEIGNDRRGCRRVQFHQTTSGRASALQSSARDRSRAPAQLDQRVVERLDMADVLYRQRSARSRHLSSSSVGSRSHEAPARDDGLAARGAVLREGRTKWLAGHRARRARQFAATPGHRHRGDQLRLSRFPGGAGIESARIGPRHHRSFRHASMGCEIPVDKPGLWARDSRENYRAGCSMRDDAIFSSQCSANAIAADTSCGPTGCGRKHFHPRPRCWTSTVRSINRSG